MKKGKDGDSKKRSGEHRKGKDSKRDIGNLRIQKGKISGNYKKDKASNKGKVDTHTGKIRIEQGNIGEIQERYGIRKGNHNTTPFE